MPIIASKFKASFPFTNQHFSTFYRTLFTNPTIQYTRKRLKTEDDDFIDLDISNVNSTKVALLIHGLEGSSNSKYIISTANFLNKNGIDVVVFNLRGCSGEMNNLYKAYHSGETQDLDFVIQHLISNYKYTSIALVGFSLGGNMVLKYAGEKDSKLSKSIKSILSISTPCDLKGSSIELSKKSNAIYMKYFLKTLVVKALDKKKQFPTENLNIGKMKSASTFYEFDNLYTAPSFGFKDAEDYWKKASCLPFLSHIKRPSYILTSQDDPFLSESCYPREIALQNKYLNLEITPFGGHIGFVRSFGKRKEYWMENTILNFIEENWNETL